MHVRLMVVDPSPALAQRLVRQLELTCSVSLAGHAATGAEAAAWLEAHHARFDFVVLDLALAQGSGYQLIDAFRTKNPAARIAVFSDHLTPAVKVQCVEYGADQVFQKREIDALVAAISRMAATAAPGAGPLPGQPAP
jgi:DNA-binding NarL/FixJ family response regulator